MLRASVALGVLTIGVASCAGEAVESRAPSPSPSVTAASSDPSHASATHSAAASSPAATAPPELTGSWRRSINGVGYVLTMTGAGYTVQTPGDSGAGRISVEGDRIEFSHSNRCPDGIGLYTWSIEEGRLRFTEIEPDPCGRADFLPRGTWGPIEP
jgi:hypothetical protein